MALLEMLLRKDNRAYISFYNALIKEAYDDLASLLHDDLPQISPEVYKSTSDGFTSYGEKVEVWKVVLPMCENLCMFEEINNI